MRWFWQFRQTKMQRKSLVRTVVLICQRIIHTILLDTYARIERKRESLREATPFLPQLLHNGQPQRLRSCLVSVSSLWVLPQ